MEKFEEHPQKKWERLMMEKQDQEQGITFNNKPCKNGCNCIEVQRFNNGEESLKRGYQCLLALSYLNEELTKKKSAQPEPVVSNKSEVTDERDIIPFVSINGIRYRPEVENRIIANQDFEPGRDTDYPEIIAFLMGIGEIDGYSFGDTPKDKRGKFWWRTRLYKWYNEFAHQERHQSRQDTVEECIYHLGLLFPEFGNKEFSIIEIRRELEKLKKKAL